MNIENNEHILNTILILFMKLIAFVLEKKWSNRRLTVINHINRKDDRTLL